MMRTTKKNLTLKQKEFKDSPFLPFFDLAEDVVNSFFPYKSFYEAGKDFIQPIRGIGNILFSMVVALLLLLLLVAVALSLLCDHENTLPMLKQCLYLITNSLALFVKGVVQVITAPLTWLIKMPLRLIYTIKKEQTHIISRREIQALLMNTHDFKERRSETIPEQVPVLPSEKKRRRNSVPTPKRGSCDGII